MIKISNTDAYQGMDKIDISVMEDEIYTCFNSDQRGEREQTQQFFLLDETTIILEVYWNGERVHEVSFENKANLTESGKMKLAEQKKDAAIKIEGEKEMEKTNNAVGKLVSEMEGRLGSLGCLVEDLGYIKSVLGVMAGDANDKIHNKMDAYFLWDNNATLQTIDNLMFRLIKELEEDYKRIDDIKEELCELTKNREFITKKA